MAEYTVYFWLKPDGTYTVHPNEQIGVVLQNFAITVTGPAMPALPKEPQTYKQVLLWQLDLIENGYLIKWPRHVR